MNFVEAPHVAGKKRLQDARCRGAIDQQQQVEVIRHQDIGTEENRIALAHSPKRFDKNLVVTLPEENLLPVIAPGHRDRGVLRHELADDTASRATYQS